MFKEISEFGGKYHVSDSGVVVNKHGRVMKPRANPRTGYVQCFLTKDGKLVSRYLHRLVAESFIPNPECLPHNRADNLEWVTRSENMQHAYKTGLSKTAKIVAFTTLGKFVREFSSEREAMKFCGVSYNAGISNCLRGVTKTAHGYVWKYKQKG